MMMKRRILLTFFAWSMALPGPELAMASPRTLTIQNLSAASISAIAVYDKQNPEQSITAPLQQPLSASEFADLSFELANDACLHDVSYVYGSGERVIKENVDLCTTDVLILE